MATTNERGFVQYDKFEDTYGSVVKIVESSSVTEDCIWIFCRNERHGVGESKDFTPHLNLEQAKRVRDALEAFINEREK